MDPNKPTDAQMMDQAALASYADDLIKERYQDTPPENVDQVKGLLLKEINEAINSHLITQLDENDQVALDELLDKNPDDTELNQFFIDKIPNLEVEIASALLNFRAAYLTPLPGGPIDLKAELDKTTEEEGSESLDAPPPPPPPPAPVSSEN